MKDSFVYIWKNKISGRKYIGYHKGSQDDGYVSSAASESFWEDYNNQVLVREVLFEGSMNDCLKYEQDYLKSIDLRSDEWYNNARGSEIIFTDEVRNKIRNHHLGGSSGMKGKKHSDETKGKISKMHKNRLFSQEHLKNLKKPNQNKGKKNSEEFRQLVRERTRDNKIYEFFNINTKEIFVGARHEFSKTFNIANHNIKGLINEKTKILGKTWILQK